MKPADSTSFELVKYVSGILIGVHLRASVVKPRFCGSVSPQDEPVIYAPRLAVLQRRQVGHGGGGSFVEDAFRHRLQGAPARPIQVRRVGDLAKQAPPLDDHPVNVAWADQISYPTVFVQRVLVDRSHDLLRPSAVLGWNAV